VTSGSERESCVGREIRERAESRRDGSTRSRPTTRIGFGAVALGLATTLAVVAAPVQVPEGEASLSRAVACNAREDWRCGVPAGARAVELLPGRADAHYAYAVALRQKLSDISFVRAVFGAGAYRRALHRALELDPDHIPARAEEIGYLIRAPGIVGGDRAKARERIAELRALAPREGALAAADVLARAGETELAIEIWNEYLDAFADDVPGLPTRSEVERRRNATLDR
jgi:hypothetical protein